MNFRFWFFVGNKKEEFIFTTFSSIFKKIYLLKGQNLVRFSSIRLLSTLAVKVFSWPIFWEVFSLTFFKSCIICSKWTRRMIVASIMVCLYTIIMKSYFTLIWTEVSVRFFFVKPILRKKRILLL